ncbi:MAG: DEAD/DEAH box helicase, partial [Mycobacterium sp.]
SAAVGLDVPSRRREAAGERDVDPELAGLREQLRRHPAHNAADGEVQARIAERYLRIERDNEQIRQKVAAATNSLARTFDKILVLLTERGFVDRTGDTPKVTEDGRLLARIYSESDLLVAECLRHGVWEGLTPAELAAVVSAVQFESRGDGTGPQGLQIPTGGVRRALAGTRRLWSEIRSDEQRQRIAHSREPDDGFVAAIHQWATTGDLASSLAASDVSGTGTALSAGDFVRWCRQVLDLLDQVRNAAPTPALRATAKRAITDIRRGVVAVEAG